MYSNLNRGNSSDNRNRHKGLDGVGMYPLRFAIRGNRIASVS